MRKILERRLRAELAELQARLGKHPDLVVMDRGPKDHREAWMARLGFWRWTATDGPPVTVGEALAAFEAEAAAMAADLAERIETAARALVAPELVVPVLTWPDLAERWPIPGRGRGQDRLEGRTGAARGYAARAVLLGPDAARFYWAGEAAPLEVADWARDALNKLEGGAGDLASEMAKHGFPAEISGIPGGGIALLFLAERAQEGAPAAPSMFLAAVDKPPVRTMGALTGADPRYIDDDAELLADPATGLFFRWDDGTDLQVEMDFGGKDAGPLQAIAQKYGDAAVRDLLAVYLLTWAARRPADAAVWWWPNEHLSLVGKAENKDNRKQLRTWLDRMSRAELTVRYRKGGKLVAPVLANVATDGAAYQVKLHPALYRGVTRDDGARGRYWWPVPEAVLRLPAVGTKVHAAAPILGSIFRAQLGGKRGPVARIGAQRLAERLGIGGGSHYPGRLLRKTLNDAEAAGLVGAWHLRSGGDLDRLTGTLEIHPGPESAAIAKGAPMPRPAWIPATMGDLERWMRHQGWTAETAAERLNVNPRTILRALAAADEFPLRPVSPQLRNALRAYLWP